MRNILACSLPPAIKLISKGLTILPILRLKSMEVDQNDEVVTCSAANRDSKNNSTGVEGTPAREGRASVFLPTSVFYNPVQEFNRDITIAIISEHAFDHIKNPFKNRKRRRLEGTIEVDCENLKPGVRYESGLRVLEGLSASGLRSTRFGLEIPGIKEIIANDFDKKAVEFIEKNIQHNRLEHLITSSCDDAAMVMYANRKSYASDDGNQFHVIDLDPYGSPAPFLDGAVQSIADGGLLCVTCTDMAILCGNAPEACYAKYGSMPLRIRSCHEMALRIILNSIETHANRYSRYIQPMLSISADFYIRVFVKMFTGQHLVKRSITKRSYVHHCVGCGSFDFVPVGIKTPTKGDNFKFSPGNVPNQPGSCSQCGSRITIGGPIWTEPIHDEEFVNKVLGSVKSNPERFGTADRIKGILSMVSEELHDVPLYYVTDDLCKTLHCTPPNLLQMRSAILSAGFKVSLSHAAKNSIKTNAPASVIWDILRCWVKEHPVSERRLKESLVASKLLEQQPSIEASFEILDDANPPSRKQGLLRWQENPDRDWGPKARAHGGRVETLEERRLKGIQKSENRKRKVEENKDMEQESMPVN